MTLVDTGPFLGEESPLPGRDRDRITRKTLEMSDKVVMVVRGDPVGIKHLFWSLEGLSGSVPSERCILVVNRSLSGGDGEILSAIRSRVGMAAKVVVPFVPADTAYALDRGRSLHECRPSSPVVEAARLVADSLFADRRVRGVLARLGGKAS